MKIGEAAPSFHDLAGVDGKSHGLADYADAPVLVLLFSCNHCPYVQAYEDRLIDLQARYASKGVRFAAINANDSASHPEDGFDAMVRRAKEKKFNFDYLRDASQAVARAYGATHTPHLFVFDRNRKLCYTGRIDDNWQDPAAVRRPYLAEAIDAILKGASPAEPETFAIGCTIKWKSA